MRRYLQNIYFEIPRCYKFQKLAYFDNKKSFNCRFYLLFLVIFFDLPSFRSLEQAAYYLIPRTQYQKSVEKAQVFRVGLKVRLRYSAVLALYLENPIRALSTKSSIFPLVFRNGLWPPSSSGAEDEYVDADGTQIYIIHIPYELAKKNFDVRPIMLSKAKERLGVALN